ncbi:elongation of fatty acids protein 3-like [Iris pallida]|uniref:very-long-chain 3-oxoacyl-CoA synthase n=1 Tax=Iris pallida TaxID=29817 RepID=A0AAX6E9F1_IRIPA|nr:elongation of fatty acids protein 3-like [Iris pallida]
MVYQTLHYYLVSHPTISSFEWNPHRTPASSLPFLATTVLSYLSLTLLFRRTGLRLPLLSPSLLRAVSSLHNLNLLLLSLAMALGCSLSSLHQMPSPSWLLCFPPRTTPAAAGPVFFWAYVFYLSKIYELLDTLLILLSGAESRTRRLTFLHVYHHSVVPVMCYVWLRTRQSLLPVALTTNAAVHVAMYAYYLSASAGLRWGPRWKRAVTEAQIWQFAFSFAVSLALLYLHFFRRRGDGGEGCQGMDGWLFNAAFNVSLFVLFLDFHATAYKNSERKTKSRNGLTTTTTAAATTATKEEREN